MALQEILEIEKGFWKNGEDYFQQHVDQECLVVFPEVAGVKSRDAIATTASGPRWREIDFELKGFLEPTPDTAILSYRARGVRHEGEVYDALVSTAYVRRETGWKMIFHQQTFPTTDRR